VGCESLFQEMDGKKNTSIRRPFGILLEHKKYPL
jgi:hypothetical protein